MSDVNSSLLYRAIELADLRVLQIAGDDRLEFLQGQLTQDTGQLSPGRSALGGWSTAKGRLLATGQLISAADAVLWPLPADIIDGVARRLGMFLLRANAAVTIAEHSVFGLIGLEPGVPAGIDGLTIDADPKLVTSNAECVASRMIGDESRGWLLGPRTELLAALEAAAIPGGDTGEWALADIRAGLPNVRAATSESFIPQMLNLDLLGGISFTKGCYVGQEIVARTQNLGRIKRRMYRFGAPSMLAPGTAIFGPAGATGKVVETAASGDAAELTAVVAIDDAEGTWFADEARTVALEHLPLPYAPARD
jgi:folate-binding protein YgfZ